MRGCSSSSPTTWAHRTPTMSRLGTARLFPHSPLRLAGREGGCAGLCRASGLAIPRPGLRPGPPRLQGPGWTERYLRAPAPAPAPNLAAPGRLTLCLRRREGRGMGRTPQAAALRPTDSGSSALLAHGACAEQGGGPPPIRTRDCTPARWLPAGLRRSTGVHLCPNKRALTPNQDCWACPGKPATNHRRDDAPETADLLSLPEPKRVIGSRSRLKKVTL